jgi:ParB family chromosome partitioning protein
LGKGLDALISTSQETEESPAGVMEIPTRQIKKNPHQPRKNFDQEELADLASSILEHGVIQPLIVTKGENENEYILIAGERRLEASKLAQLEKVPAIVREATDREMLLLALIENVQRADLNPIETAEAYNYLAEQFSLTHKEIGELVGKKRPTVSNTLSLLNASAQVKQALLDGKIREGHASAIHTLPVQTQNAIADAHEEFNFSVRQMERLAGYLRDFPMEQQLSELKKALKKQLYLPQKEKPAGESAPQTQPAAPKAAQPSISAEFEAIRIQLEDYLETKVSMRNEGDGGTFTIRYYSTEELNRILDKIFKD